MTICPTCAQENPPIAQFCLACGRQLAAAKAAAREERRIVTVIFVDLVGFTSRAETLDPEDVRAILAPYHDRVRAEIESFGGVVEKFIGDAVVGVFGAPTAFGDDPERAVRSALSVRAALGAQVRMAVNTGEALVTMAARPELGEAMVAGDVINTAARLQSAAPAGGVLVGGETYRCTHQVVEYSSAEPVIAKGKEAPIEVWLAERLCDEAGRPGTPLVGRVGELAMLKGIWERAVVGSPHLVTVLGPPGVGKSRLASEFRRMVDADGGRTVRGRCLPYRESSAYGAFATQVKQFASIFENDEPELVLGKLRAECDRLAVPDPAVVAGHLGIILGIDPSLVAEDRETLFFSVRCFVEAITAEQPVVLVFEDIHWADPVLLDLIEQLTGMHGSRVLLLTLARPELLDSRPGWGGGLPGYISMSLQPLVGDEAQALAFNVLRGIEESERQRRAAAFAEMAEGNPLFIEQLAATLAERPAGSPDALPTTIRGIVTARLDALPADERAVLLTAAVMGKVFWRGPVERVTDDATPLGDALAALERRDLIRREPVSAIAGERQYSFRHMMIRDAAYEMLPRTRRQELHADLARYLEAEAPEAGEAVTQIARHWREAGKGDRAVRYFIAAGEEAERGWAMEHAALLYREAFDLVRDDQSDTRRDLRRRLALVYWRSFHRDEPVDRPADGDQASDKTGEQTGAEAG
ncbi:MAG TPA: AAA family ATPase [Gaiellales bacterium]|nr:AAA family ATPase [Gaiellales bacterium]